MCAWPTHAEQPLSMLLYCFQVSSPGHLDCRTEALTRGNYGLCKTSLNIRRFLHLFSKDKSMSHASILVTHGHSLWPPTFMSFHALCCLIHTFTCEDTLWCLPSRDRAETRTASLPKEVVLVCWSARAACVAFLTCAAHLCDTYVISHVITVDISPKPPAFLHLLQRLSGLHWEHKAQLQSKVCILKSTFVYIWVTVEQPPCKTRCRFAGICCPDLSISERVYPSHCWVNIREIHAIPRQQSPGRLYFLSFLWGWSHLSMSSLCEQFSLQAVLQWAAIRFFCSIQSRAAALSCPQGPPPASASHPQLQCCCLSSVTVSQLNQL